MMNATQETVPTTAQATAQATIATYFAATRSLDLDTWLSTFAVDAMSYEPGQPQPLQGHVELAAFFQGIVAGFKTVGLTANQVFSTGNQVAVKWTGRGVGHNDRTVTFEGIDVFELNAQGKIQQMWGYWDPAALRAQLV